MNKFIVEIKLVTHQFFLESNVNKNIVSNNQWTDGNSHLINNKENFIHLQHLRGEC